MADPFDCPKCGAPLTYNAQEQNYAETISCPYCNNSVIVPEVLRVRPPQAERLSPEMLEVTEALREAASYRPRSSAGYPARTAQPNPPMVQEVGSAPKVGRLVGGCLVLSFLITAVFGAIMLLTVSQFKNSLLQAVNQVAPTLAQQPTETDVVASVQTQIAPLMEQVTQAVGQVNKPSSPTPVPSDTPGIDVTATAAAAAELEATRAAQRAQFEEQSNWPVVLQEKFSNASRNWNVGSENGKLAVEDIQITGNQYIWQITSKKSMGSFTYPDMDTQTDLFVSVDLKMTVSSGNLSDQAGIIFRDDNGAFYFFGANPLGAYSLRQYDGSGWNELIPLTDSNLFKEGQVNHLAVSMVGTQILLAINNQMVDAIEDSALSQGVAGLGVNLPAAGEDATVIFTNFIVRAP